MVSFELPYASDTMSYATFMKGAGRIKDFVSLSSEIKEWLSNAGAKYVTFVKSNDKFKIMFFDKGHAAMFKLTWL